MICIYAIINIVDDAYYVGQASDRDYRWREHRKQLRGFYHHSLYLQRAWCKYGEANFIFVVLEILDDVSKLNEREIHWGNLLKPEYNVAPLGGSMRGYTHTDEARQNMSNAHKGHKHSEETKAIMSEQRKGNKFAAGQKHSQARIDARLTNIRGIPKTVEHKAKIAEGNRGKIVSPETRLRQSVAAKARKERERKEALDKLLNLNITAGKSSWSD